MTSQLDQLRQIIVGDNSEKLNELRQRVEDVERRTHDVSEVLAPAITETMRRDNQLVSALRKPVSETLKRAVRAEPEEYADILYPAIAPSIRTAIAQAISSLLTTINKTVASATTFGGMQARIESLRTGVPYGELLLRQSLAYQVEHLYLIDRESGLLIGEYGEQAESRMDSDAVSAMFSAIQSFVQDSFSGDEEDRLTDFKVGSHNVWIAHGPKTMLACIVWGDAPESLKHDLYAALETIRTKYSQQIKNFDGDAGEFLGLQDHLQPLMQSQLKAKTNEKTWEIGPFLIYLIVTGLLIYSVYLLIDRNAKLNTAQKYLDAAPGLVVTNARWRNDTIVIDGLQDPDAELPLAFLEQHGIGRDRLTLKMTPFRSLEPKMELKRFFKELQPPAGVTLGIVQGKVMLQGDAPSAWLIEHRVRLRQLQADNRLDLSSLTGFERKSPEASRSNR